MKLISLSERDCYRKLYGDLLYHVPHYNLRNQMIKNVYVPNPLFASLFGFKLFSLLLIVLMLSGFKYETFIEAKKDYCERMYKEAKKIGKEPLFYDPFYYNCLDRTS